MIFNTHDRTPRVESDKKTKIILIIPIVLIYLMVLFAAVATSLMAHNSYPAILILAPTISLTAIGVITFIDMKKAFVEIIDNSIKVVDYYFLFKKEKRFNVDDIKTAQIKLGNSFAVRGYRHSMMGFSYIIFRGDNNKYLFKVINCPETRDFFCRYIDMDESF